MKIFAVMLNLYCLTLRWAIETATNNSKLPSKMYRIRQNITLCSISSLYLEKLDDDMKSQLCVAISIKMSRLRLLLMKTCYPVEWGKRMRAPNKRLWHSKQSPCQLRNRRRSAATRRRSPCIMLHLQAMNSTWEWMIFANQSVARKW